MATQTSKSQDIEGHSVEVRKVSEPESLISRHNTKYATLKHTRHEIYIDGIFLTNIATGYKDGFRIAADIIRAQPPRG